MTHTKGPWVSDQVANAFRIYAKADPAGMIARLPYGSDFNEQDANARLIAAAPTMLEALKEAKRYFVNRPGNEETQLNELIGSAIARAMGEEVKP